MSYFVSKIGHLYSLPPFLQSYILCNTGVEMSGVEMSDFPIDSLKELNITTRISGQYSL